MTGIIILAAGSSTRMGRAKQNLLYQGETLLQSTVNSAIQCGAEAVAVVLGANADEIEPTIANMPVHVFINKNWNDGMGSSISYGLREMLFLHPKLDNILYLLTDQPFINTDAIKNLIASGQPKKIIASTYNNTLGPPVLFNRAFFADLLEMKGNEGAKKLIYNYPDAVISIPFAAGAFDIDTPEDYERLQNSD